MGNQLAGAERSVTRSIRGPEGLFDEFDEWIESSDYDDRSKAIRAFMKDAIGGAPESDLTPLEPPREEPLADAYRRLCRAGYPDGKVRKTVAERVAVKGHPENLGTDDAPALVLHPLRRRGYLRCWNGHPAQRTPLTVWEIVGWDETDASE